MALWDALRLSSGLVCVWCRSVRVVAVSGALGLSAGVSGLVAGAVLSGGLCEGVTLSSCHKWT